MPMPIDFLRDGSLRAARIIWSSTCQGLFKEAGISPPSELISQEVITTWATIIENSILESMTAARIKAKGSTNAD